MSKYHLLAIPLVLATAIAVSSCSSTSSTPAATGGDAVSKCVSTVNAAVDKARADVPLVLPDSPIDLAKVKGKNIWVIDILTNQFMTDANAGLKAAADAAGVNLTIFDGQGTANGWNEGIQKAIAQKADAIALFGIDSSIVKESVQEAIAAGIPVTESLAVNYDAKHEVKLFSSFSADYTADGASLAEWTLADSKCTANTYLLYSTALPIWVNMQQGILDTYKNDCPQCKITDDNVDLANVATELPRLTQTKLTQSPDTGYIIATWDSAIPFIESAASTVNSDVKLLARDGIAATLEEIRKDGMQKVTVAAPPPQWIAWVIVDDLLRAVAGEKPNGLKIPTRLVDKTNIGKTDTDVMPAYVNFESAFKKAWGL